jgi:hypothetical protein
VAKLAFVGTGFQTVCNKSIRPTVAISRKAQIALKFNLNNGRHFEVDSCVGYFIRGGSVGLELKPDFFIYLVKPEPKSDLSPTYVVNFSSPKMPEPKI